MKVAKVYNELGNRDRKIVDDEFGFPPKLKRLYDSGNGFEFTGVDDFANFVLTKKTKVNFINF